MDRRDGQGEIWQLADSGSVFFDRSTDHGPYKWELDDNVLVISSPYRSDRFAISDFVFGRGFVTGTGGRAQRRYEWVPRSSLAPEPCCTACAASAPGVSANRRAPCAGAVFRLA